MSEINQSMTNMNNLIFLILFSILALVACKSTTSVSSKPKKELTHAHKILAQAIEAHGGKRYDNAHYEFIFRKNKYTFKNSKAGFEYTVRKSKDGKVTFDKMSNNGFTRTVDGEELQLTAKQKDSYSSSLNSVIYFATLPYKLQDPAVNLSYKGETTIKGKIYEVLQITFDKEGGGKDHDDVYHYWVNKETKVIDYLAYNFIVNNGGVRFRSAYNTRNVNGILFQNYINFKAPVGTPLMDLPKLFEKEELKKLSLIETEAVRSLRE